MLIRKLYTVCILGGLICAAVGTIMKLIETNWVWNPLYYGILLVVIGFFILLGVCIYEYYDSQIIIEGFFDEDDDEDKGNN